MLTLELSRFLLDGGHGHTSGTVLGLEPAAALWLFIVGGVGLLLLVFGVAVAIGSWRVAA